MAPHDTIPSISAERWTHQMFCARAAAGERNLQKKN